VVIITRITSIRVDAWPDDWKYVAGEGKQLERLVEEVDP
jgi:hypothetical protein